MKREASHRYPANRQLGGYLRYYRTGFRKPRDDRDGVIDCAQELGSESVLPFLIPDRCLFKFGGRFRLCEETTAQRLVRRRETSARTSSHGLA